MEIKSFTQNRSQVDVRVPDNKSLQCVCCCREDRSGIKERSKFIINSVLVETSPTSSDLSPYDPLSCNLDKLYVVFCSVKNVYNKHI